MPPSSSPVQTPALDPYRPGSDYAGGSEHDYHLAMMRKAGNARPVISNVNQDGLKLSDREAMWELFQLPTYAGPPVTVTSATQVTAVYAAAALIAGAVASLPLNFYERTDDTDGRRRIKHDLWWFFNEQPSPLVPAAVFWEYMISTKLFHGDGFALLVRDRNGKIIEVLPLSPLEVWVQRERDYLSYYVNSQDLGVFGVHHDDMLHFHGFGFNLQGRAARSGRGLSVIQHAARQAIGNALAADQFAGQFFANGAQPGHVISYPGGVTQEQIDKLRERWAEKHAGPSNAGKPMVLTHGATLKELTMTLEDAQLLETRRFQVEDIARAFGVPPFMIGATDKTSSWGSGVEHMGQGFVTFTLQRHLNPAEQEINRKCFRTAKYFCEFNVDGLQRGDLKARGDYYRQAIGGSQGPGWMSANQIRRLENEEPDSDAKSNELFRPATTSTTSTTTKGDPNAPKRPTAPPDPGQPRPKP